MIAPYSSPTDVLDRMVWEDQEMRLGELIFTLQHGQERGLDPGSGSFVCFKTKELAREYRDLFSRYPDFRADNVFELGIWKGGGIAFWREVLNPRKIVAIDILEPFASPYRDRYIEGATAKTEISLYWQINQADREKLLQLAASHFDSKLDFVIDDASHMYPFTKKSFEILFPLVRPGGIYIIEDWAWNHWPSHQPADHVWKEKVSPSELAFELQEAIGSFRAGISHMETYPGFLAIHRNKAALGTDYSLDHAVTRRHSPPYSWFNR